jgi:hypothetical protein
VTNAPSAPITYLPYPLLVNALTGVAGGAVPLENLTGSRPDLPGADQRIANSKHLGTDYSVDDPNDLTQAGWGILFASDADPAIQKQLQPLIDLRKSQVQDDKLFQVFSENTGVQPGQTAASWAQQRGVSLTAPVDPYQGGVPYYLLIVGSPDRISFEFQALMKMQWAVGRLFFDDVNDYGRYAQAIVRYESKAFKPVQRKSAAVWITRNYGDLATAMLSGALSEDFLATNNMLGARRQFTTYPYVNEKATKAQLIEILRGNCPGGPPAVIFTGSHGCDYSGADVATQTKLQGSLLTQDWIPGTPANSTNQFCGDDVPPDAQLLGTMGFVFACYSGGCPTVNGYYFNKDGSPIIMAPAPMVSRLPQALLSRGMLAVIAHVDLAFPYAFQDVTGTPQVQAVRTPLEFLMSGKRVGLAADSLSVMWSSRSSQLDSMKASLATAPAGSVVPNAPASNSVAQLTIARDDAKNYIVLGDPAAQLRILDLT